MKKHLIDKDGKCKVCLPKIVLPVESVGEATRRMFSIGKVSHK